MADDALPTPEPRKKASKKRIGELLKRQRGLCALCPTVLAKINQGMVFICAPFDVDHVLPLDLLGGQDDDNLQCLCVPCHKAKTKTDIKHIAKGRRVRTDQERHATRMRMKATMTPAAVRREKLKEKIAAGNRKIQSRGFSKQEARLPLNDRPSRNPNSWNKPAGGLGFRKHPTMKRTVSGKVVPR